jgi:spore germination protein KA
MQNAQDAKDPKRLDAALAANLKRLDGMFGRSADYYAKRVVLYGCPAALVLFDGLASLESLWQLLLDAASREAAQAGGEARQPPDGQAVYEHILHASALPAEADPVEDLAALTRCLTAGMAVLLLDGCEKGIAFSVQGLKFRSVDEPAAEGDLRGSREGFADLLRVNLTLLRRLIRTPALVQEVAQADTPMRTEYAVCYCRDRADPAMVETVKERLRGAKPEMLLDSSYFMPWLAPPKRQGRSVRLFAPVRYTERPAVAAAKLREGKIVVLVNGSPSALVLPALFSEHFECLDDYGSAAYFASFLRALKYGSFWLTVFLPGVFVCLAVYLPELIPPQVLYKIQAAEQATPLPLFAEMVLVILLLEIIREAGLRMPQSLGHSVSLVAALIIGDAAIGAGLLSTPVILVASVTSIAVFVTPSLYEAASVLRLAVVLAAGLGGPAGLAAAALAVGLALAQVELLGVSYLKERPFPAAPLSPDGVTRRNYRRLSQRPFNIWQDQNQKE